MKQTGDALDNGDVDRVDKQVWDRMVLPLGVRPIFKETKSDEGIAIASARVCKTDIRWHETLCHQSVVAKIISEGT